ncbi:imm11 family protein [Burkholderia vietnamiensis]|uniref:imm11 family protein n=1 Tax=Burkholderia vietnamiensis TaxID=60552 RepID=UPI0012DB12DE|nr:DUF1629 domain-containing protein [Burkholderia vietnamiensis]MBR7977022.1 hypothetical protein [Burkholderia vietnamiensis]
MTEIYVLTKDDKFPTLVQDDSQEQLTAETDFALRAASLEMHGKEFASDYTPVKLKVAAEDARKKGVSDVQTHFMSFLIFTENAFESLSDLLQGAGQVLPVDDRFPNLRGFHVTRVISGAVDFERSQYVMYDKGPLIRKLVLRDKKVENIPIFKIHEDPTRVFVSGEFKKHVEQHKLRGFSFLRKIELS